MSRSRKTKDLVSVAGSTIAVGGAVAALRRARARRDALRVVNAIASTVAALTGTLIAVRALRKGQEDT
jgi:hypothetical protein